MLSISEDLKTLKTSSQSLATYMQTVDNLRQQLPKIESVESELNVIEAGAHDSTLRDLDTELQSQVEKDKKSFMAESQKQEKN